MEYLHASLILHSAGKKITAKALEDILSAAGITPDKNRIKGLVAALNEVNIEEALEAAATMPTAHAQTAAPAPSSQKPAQKAEPEPEEEEEEEEEAGLSSLFG